MSRVYHTQKEIGSGCKVKGMVVKKKVWLLKEKDFLDFKNSLLWY